MATTESANGHFEGHEVSRLPQSALLFDAKNPRLAGYLDDDTEPTQDALIQVLWREMAVDELAMSIAASGFFDFEPLFCVKEGRGRYIVVEGNRRLAAVRLLLDKDLRERLHATDLPRISAARAKSLRELPAIVLSERKEGMAIPRL